MQEPTVNAMHLAVESSPTPACLNSQAQRRLARTPGAGPHHAQLGARRRALGWRQPRRAGKDRGHPGGPPVHDGRKQAVRVSVPLISFTASHTEEFETTKNLIKLKNNRKNEGCILWNKGNASLYSTKFGRVPCVMWSKQIRKFLRHLVGSIGSSGRLGARAPLCAKNF